MPTSLVFSLIILFIINRNINWKMIEVQISIIYM